MSVVRPEFGPTLPELVGPRWRALPRGGRAAALAALAVVVAVLVVLLAGGSVAQNAIVVREPIAFNLIYTDALERVPAPRGAMLQLRTPAATTERQSLVVRPLRLAPYRGDSSAALLGASSRIQARLQAADPQFAYRGEGRARINDLPGYQLSFQTLRGSQRVYGRIYLIVPDAGDGPQPRQGAELTLLADRSIGVPNVDQVGADGPLKTPLRSFRFGTERP